MRLFHREVIHENKQFRYRSTVDPKTININNFYPVVVPTVPDRPSPPPNLSRASIITDPANQTRNSRCPLPSLDSPPCSGVTYAVSQAGTACKHGPAAQLGGKKSAKVGRLFSIISTLFN